MRLMLGIDTPSLLVEVNQDYSSRHFEFTVVNGRWEGTYDDGRITVWHPDHPWSNLDKHQILTSNQDRLRGDYNTVFDNFKNPNYIAPAQKHFPDMDDDIPF